MHRQLDTKLTKVCYGVAASGEVCHGADDMSHGVTDASRTRDITFLLSCLKISNPISNNYK